MKKLFIILILMSNCLLIKFNYSFAQPPLWQQTSCPTPQSLGNQQYVLATSGSNIFAATGFKLFYSATSNNVYLSTNSGSSWDAINTASLPQPSNPNNFIASIAAYGNYVFVGFTNTGIYMSSNNGTSWSNWTSLTNSPQSTTIFSIAISNDGSYMLAAGGGGGTDGVFRATSANNFTDWTEILPGNTRSIVIQPSNKNNCVCCGTNGIYYSTNGGLNWTNSKGITNPFYGLVAISNDGTMTFALPTTPINNAGVGIQYSIDQGQSWTNKGVVSGLPTSDPNIGLNSLVISNDNKYIYLGCVQDAGYGVYVSTDNATGWSATPSLAAYSNGLSAINGTYPVTSLAIYNNTTVFAGTVYGVYDIGIGATCPNPTPTCPISPTPSTISNFSSQTFTVSPQSGYSPLSYQWQLSTDGTTYNNATIGTTTNSTYTINPPVGTYYYKCAVTQCAAQNSQAATLTVIPEQNTFNVNSAPTPTITADGNDFLCVTDITSKRYHTSDLGPTYSWTFPNGGGIVSARDGTSDILVTWNDAGNYVLELTVTNSSGCTGKVDLPVTIYSLASVQNQPSNQNITPGSPASFAISVSDAGIGLTFKWQEYNGIGWGDITDGGSSPQYSNSATQTLNMGNVPSGKNGYKYRCVVYANAKCGGTATSNEATLTVGGSGRPGYWTGATGTDWNIAGNWEDNHVPGDPGDGGSSVDVHIGLKTNEPIISSNALYTVRNINIEPVASLTVNANLSCTSITIQSDATGTGALNQNGNTITVSSGVTMQRYIPNSGYHYITSPVNGASCGSISGFTISGNNNGKEYDPDNPPTASHFPNMWEIKEDYTHNIPADLNSWWAPSASETMTVMKGYAINVPAAGTPRTISISSSSFIQGSQSFTVSREDVGSDSRHDNMQLNEYGQISPPAAKGPQGYFNVTTGPTNGWHLIGNPYPSPIDWTDIVEHGGTTLNTGHSISIFKTTSQYGGVYGALSDLFIADSWRLIGSGSFTPSKFIPSMQSFFVLNGALTGLPDNSSALNVTNSNRNVTSSALSAKFYRDIENTETGTPLIDLFGYKSNSPQSTEHSPQTMMDKAVIYFSSQLPVASSQNSAPKLMNTDEDVPNIYSISPQSTEKSPQSLSVQGFKEISEGMTIPLGFYVNSSGNYTIRGNVTQMPSGIKVYILDTKNKVIQDLNIKPSYSFNIEKGDDGRRFYLKFSQQSASINQQSELFEAYSNNNKLYINYYCNDCGEGRFGIYNLEGQLISEMHTISSGHYEYNIDKPTGIYILKMYTDKRVYVSKFFVNK